MSTSRDLNRKNAIAAAVLILASVAVPATAASNPQTYQDNVTPMSASQSAMLRHGAPANADVAAAMPSNDDVPASRSQIEVLDLSHVRHARMAQASQ